MPSTCSVETETSRRIVGCAAIASRTVERGTPKTATNPYHRSGKSRKARKRKHDRRSLDEKARRARGGEGRRGRRTAGGAATEEDEVGVDRKAEEEKKRDGKREGERGREQEKESESGTVTVTMPGRHDGGWYGSSRQPESRLAEADCLSIAPPLSSSSLLRVSLSLSPPISLLLLSPFPTSPAVGR